MFIKNTSLLNNVTNNTRFEVRKSSLYKFKNSDFHILLKYQLQVKENLSTLDF